MYFAEHVCSVGDDLIFNVLLHVFYVYIYEFILLNTYVVLDLFNVLLHVFYVYYRSWSSHFPGMHLNVDMKVV